MTRIAIFASGSGSNAENIVNYFNENDTVEISLILTNKANAFVLERAKKLSIESLVFNRRFDHFSWIFTKNTRKSN
jgi:phosphoribosylglycinamide formyltransferase-1